MNWENLFWGLVSGVIGIIWAEFNEIMPWLTQRVMQAALRFVPAERRERDAEEWRAILADTPGKLWPLWVSCGFWWGASKERIRRRVGVVAYEATMRLIDIVLGYLIFALISPLYFLISLAVLIAFGGPPHCYVRRIGKNGKPIRLLRFKTRNFAQLPQENNSRSTPADGENHKLAIFLRRTGLNLLPEFRNVMRGDLSLVGPRPLALVRANELGSNLQEYCSVKPGVTSLSAVTRGNLSPAERIQIDLYYVRNRSVWLDLTILAKAIWSGFVGTHR